MARIILWIDESYYYNTYGKDVHGHISYWD
jgi:hypothetical protein